MEDERQLDNEWALQQAMINRAMEVVGISLCISFISRTNIFFLSNFVVLCFV